MQVFNISSVAVLVYFRTVLPVAFLGIERGIKDFFVFMFCLMSPFFSFRWLVIAVGLVRAYLAKGSYHSLYYSIEKPLKFFQTGALLEVGVVLFPGVTNICHEYFVFLAFTLILLNISHKSWIFLLASSEGVSLSAI